ncbi:hypothetical protein PEL8287_01361 [Roseovarius litorisediminis]|uniref:Lipoprotein n=1 Tax=Roseovarius litorisediminis TaxID=1312363 RepID=A0A1Y5S4Q9_9RHOB|nr:hypothetical protein [Roseovarius litorisediminis]SLN29735.1 hypothetical protein PEL8287_01361 [Roseovarius litorisediminis]
MIANSKKFLTVPLVFCLLASCSTPSSDDGQQRVLAVVNEGSEPIISLYAGRPGTTPGSREPTMELISRNAEGMVDFLPFGANIQPGRGGKFNIDDGNGTCVFEVYVQFLDRFSQKNEGDVCKMTREGTVWRVSN